MNFLIKILIICFIQQISIIMANPVNPVTAAEIKENFLDFYDQELFQIAEEFGEKATNLSEKLLEDKNIQEAPTAELKDFKLFLSDFLQDYPHIKRYKLYQPLLILIISAAEKDVFNLYLSFHENVAEFKDLLKQYFSSILREYEHNYREFIKEKFLPKTEVLKQQLKEEDLEKMPQFNRLVDKMKSCQHFICFPLYLDTISDKMNITQEISNKYAKRDLMKFTTLMAIHLNDQVATILNDKKLSELSHQTRKDLIEDIHDFQIKFQNNSDIEKFIQTIIEKPHFPQKYENNDKDIPPEDQEILTQILSKLRLKSSTQSKYKLERKSVMLNLSFKLLETTWLIPENEIKPFYDFLGIPFEKNPGLYDVSLKPKSKKVQINK